MLKTHKKFRSKYALLFMIAYLLFMIPGCGSENNSINTNSDTGSISFTLKLQNSAQRSNDVESPSNNICKDFDIDKIVMKLYKSSDTKDKNIVKSKRWDCEDHVGTLEGIKEGEYNLVVEGLIDETAAWAKGIGDKNSWKGRKNNINVKGGKDTLVRDVKLGWINPLNLTVPSVDTLEPDSGDTKVPRNTDITATFKEDIVTASLNKNSFYMVEKDSTKEIPSVVTPPGQTKFARLNPIEVLKANTEYTVTITTDILNMAGVKMAAKVEWTFTTGSESALPLVWNQGNWDQSLWQ